MKPVVLVEVNGPIHVTSSPLPPSKRASIGSPSSGCQNAPELNDIEVVWHDLKAHNLAHYTFTDAADLDRAIHQAVQALNNERSRNPLVNWRISVRKLSGPVVIQTAPKLTLCGSLFWRGCAPYCQAERPALARGNFRPFAGPRWVQ